MIEIETLRRYFSEDKIFATMHAEERFRQRGISIRDVGNAVKFGEIIEQYPDDYPYPSCLVLGENLRGEKNSCGIKRQRDFEPSNHGIFSRRGQMERGFKV